MISYTKKSTTCPRTISQYFMRIGSNSISKTFHINKLPIILLCKGAEL